MRYLTHQHNNTFLKPFINKNSFFCILQHNPSDSVTHFSQNSESCYFGSFQEAHSPCVNSVVVSHWHKQPCTLTHDSNAEIFVLRASEVQMKHAYVSVTGTWKGTFFKMFNFELFIQKLLWCCLHILYHRKQKQHKERKSLLDFSFSCRQPVLHTSVHRWVTFSETADKDKVHVLEVVLKQRKDTFR